jgi:hypothetical protein
MENDSKSLWSALAPESRNCNHSNKYAISPTDLML